MNTAFKKQKKTNMNMALKKKKTWIRPLKKWTKKHEYSLKKNGKKNMNTALTHSLPSVSPECELLTIVLLFVAVLQATVVQFCVQALGQQKFQLSFRNLAKKVHIMHWKEVFIIYLLRNTFYFAQAFKTSFQSNVYRGVKISSKSILWTLAFMFIFFFEELYS